MTDAAPNSYEKPVEDGDYKSRWAHVEYRKLVLAEKDFIVVVDNEIDVDWATSTEYDQESEKDSKFNRESRNRIITAVAALEVLPCEGLDEEKKIHFKRLLGEAIVCCLYFDYTGAADMMLDAQEYIRARSEEVSRYWYLTASIVSAGGAAIVGLLLWLMRSWVMGFLGSTAYWLALCAVAGALGALLSVIWRSGSLKLDCSSGKHLHHLEACSRIAGGAIAGVLVGLAINADIVLTALADGGRQKLIMILGALVSGSSERLAGSIISSVEAAGPPAVQEAKKESEIT